MNFDDGFKRCQRLLISLDILGLLIASSLDGPSQSDFILFGDGSDATLGVAPSASSSQPLFTLRFVSTGVEDVGVEVTAGAGASDAVSSRCRHRRSRGLRSRQFFRCQRVVGSGWDPPTLTGGAGGGAGVEF